MSDVYSQRVLMKYGGNDTYTVPDGKRFIGKCLSGVNAAGTAAGIQVSIGQVPVLFLSVAPVTPFNYAGLMVVAYSGEQLAVIAGPQIGYQMSGYLLDAT